MVSLSGRVTVSSRYVAMFLGIRSNGIQGSHFKRFLPEVEGGFKKMVCIRESSENKMPAQNGRMLAVYLKPVIVEGGSAV